MTTASVRSRCFSLLTSLKRSLMLRTLKFSHSMVMIIGLAGSAASPHAPRYRQQPSHAHPQGTSPPSTRGMGCRVMTLET